MPSHAITTKPKRKKRVSGRKTLTESVTLPTDWLRQFAVEHLRQIRSEWPAMDAARADRDFEALRRKTHWIKGTAGTVGLVALSELASQADTRAKVGDEESVDVLMNRISAYVESGLKQVEG